MINVLIPIMKDDKKYHDLLGKLQNNYEVTITIGLPSNLRNKFDYLKAENIRLVSFEDNANRESIINSLQSYVYEGPIMVLRKAITLEEFNRFITSDADIVVCEKPKNSIKNLFFFVWQKILKLLLGVCMYPGNTSVVYFSENVTPILAEVRNLSFSSRVDRWKGVEKTTVPITGECEKADIDKKMILRNILIMIACFVVGVTVTTLVSVFVKVNIIIGLLLFCLDAICLSIILIMVVLIVFNCLVGKKNFDYAVEVEVVNQFVQEESENLEIDSEV